MNKFKAKKVYNYLKKNNFKLDNLPPKIKLLLLDNKVRETLNLFLEDDNKIYLRKNLFFSRIGKIYDIIYTGYSTKIRAKQIDHAIINLIKKDHNDTYYEYINKNINFIDRDWFDGYKYGDIHIKNTTSLSLLLNKKGNLRDFFTKKEILLMEKFLNNELDDNKKNTDNENDDFDNGPKFF
ncbi:MAG: hypothetical protein E7359_03860 [Clostridiales bacterium]|nr:hypothetical protein [Clostridiales bacterium]